MFGGAVRAFRGAFSPPCLCLDLALHDKPNKSHLRLKRGCDYVKKEKKHLRHFLGPTIPCVRVVALGVKLEPNTGWNALKSVTDGRMDKHMNKTCLVIVTLLNKISKEQKVSVSMECETVNY